MVRSVLSNCDYQIKNSANIVGTKTKNVHAILPNSATSKMKLRPSDIDPRSKSGRQEIINRSATM